jgi:hypothetical protein
MSSPKRRTVYADILDLPEHLVAEIVDGELYTSPRPPSPHVLAASAIGSAPFEHFHQPPGGNVAAFTLAPDWVCEVVSPSTGILDPFEQVELDPVRWWLDAPKT